LTINVTEPQSRRCLGQWARGREAFRRGSSSAGGWNGSPNGRREPLGRQHHSVLAETVIKKSHSL